MNPLTLAFIGDAVMTLYERERLVRAGDTKVDTLHKELSKRICAATQSELFEKIKGKLDETELEIAGRARNAKHHTMPKSCTPGEYRNATALEAVIGYNYLRGNKSRIEEITE